MARSALALGFVLASALFGCSKPAAPPQAPAAEAPITSVLMCAPGNKFMTDAPYMVMKVTGHPDLAFERIDYICPDIGGIGFKELKGIKRTTPETCTDFRVPDGRFVPPVLSMYSEKNGRPVVYTRVNIEHTLIYLLRDNPCGGDMMEKDETPQAKAMFAPDVLADN